MASPIVLADVLSPAGDINGAVWFPALASGDVNTLVTGFIADAYTKTDDDDAAEQWVYYRAATEVADRMSGDAGSKSLTLVDQGSKSTSLSPLSLQYWERKAAAYLAAYEDAVAEVIDDPLGGFTVLTSLRHG